MGAQKYQGVALIGAPRTRSGHEWRSWVLKVVHEWLTWALKRTQECHSWVRTGLMSGGLQSFGLGPCGGGQGYDQACHAEHAYHVGPAAAARPAIH